MEFLESCPLCGKQVQLQQINFQTAIFICMDVKCPYPVNGDCIVVNRKIENIHETVDLLEIYPKVKKLESHTNVSEPTEDFAERNLMLDFEELINAQNGYHCPSETKNEAVFQESEQFDFKYETDYQNNQLPSTELSDLDDFLADLLR